MKEYDDLREHVGILLSSDPAPQSNLIQSLFMYMRLIIDEHKYVPDIRMFDYALSSLEPGIIGKISGIYEDDSVTIKYKHNVVRRVKNTDVFLLKDAPSGVFSKEFLAHYFGYIV